MSTVASGTHFGTVRFTTHARSKMSLFLTAAVLVVASLHFPAAGAFGLGPSPLAVGAPPAKIEGHIFGGGDVKKGRFPYIVSLRMDGVGHICGGALVSPTVVITAAHCLDAYGDPSVMPEVHIGRYCTTCEDETGYTVAQTKLRQVHPQWNPETLENGFDLAFLVLDREVDAPVVKFQNPPDPPAMDADVGLELTIIGWGKTGPDSSLSDKLQMAEVPYIPNAECRKKWLQAGLDLPMPPSLMCAGDDVKGTCNGDSGGPILLTGATWEEDLLLGVVSFGDPSCGEAVNSGGRRVGPQSTGTSPGVFTRLWSYKEIMDRVAATLPAPKASGGPQKLEKAKCEAYGDALGFDFDSGEACAAAAAANPKCGEYVAYSPDWNFRIGCSCCAPGSRVVQYAFLNLYGIPGKATGDPEQVPPAAPKQLPPAAAPNPSTPSLPLAQPLRVSTSACTTQGVILGLVDSADACIQAGKDKLASGQPSCGRAIMYSSALGSCYCCSASDISTKSSFIYEVWRF